MTPEEVKALTDEELRGWAWTLSFCTRPTQNMVSTEGHATIAGATVLVPDYPHDIAAAMELAERIPLPFGIQRGYARTWEVGVIGWWAGFGAIAETQDGEIDYAVEVWDESCSRAITRAFVLAMTQESDGMGKGDGAGV